MFKSFIGLVLLCGVIFISGCKFDGRPQTTVKTTTEGIKTDLHKIDQDSKAFIKEVNNSSTATSLKYKAKELSSATAEKVEEAYSKGSVIVKEGLSESNIKNQMNKAKVSLRAIKKKVKETDNFP